MIKCYYGGLEVKVKEFNYPAGEPGFNLESSKVDKIICWFKSSDDILRADMMKRKFPEAKLIFPYLPCSREDKPGELTSYGLRTINAIFRDYATFDIHSKVEPDKARVDNIDPSQYILRAIMLSKADGIISPDKGAADRYNLPVVAYGKKIRNQETGDIVSYELNIVPDCNSIIVIDDICDGGRTFIDLAKLLPGKELYLYVSHGIFSKGFDELKKYYKHIYTTNSYIGPRDPEFVTEMEVSL